MHKGKIDSIERSLDLIEKNLRKGFDVYEFGVFKGETLELIERFLIEKNFEHGNIVGFDSFVGFPTKEREIEKDPNTYEDWFHMNFRVVNEKNSIDDAVLQIEKIMKKKPILIPGFFSESLRDQIVTNLELKPACFIHVDCDLYTSTYEALDFMFRNNLIVPGTIVTYDEWGPFFLKENGCFGEEKAHIEICEKYGDFEFLEKIEDKAIFRKR